MSVITNPFIRDVKRTLDGEEYSKPLSETELKEIRNDLRNEIKERENIIDYLSLRERYEVLQAGESGEDRVIYQLEWLLKKNDNFVMVKGDCKGRYKNGCIVIKSSRFGSQEFDHILISDRGVFVIETKNYSGSIMINEYCDWLRAKNEGEYEGMDNPATQVGRHVDVLEDVLKNEGDNGACYRYYMFGQRKMYC